MGYHGVIGASIPSDWPNAEFSRFVACPPHRWHVQMIGSGPDLLLIHGAGGAVHSWRDLIGPLSEKNRVLAIDLPGHGFTRLGTRRRSGLDPMSADLVSLLRHLEIRPAAIVGHSAGAAIALRLAQILDPPPVQIVAINGALENFPGVAGLLFPLVAKALALNPLTAPLVAASMTPRAAKRLIEGTGSHVGAQGIDLYARLFRDRHHIAGTLNMMEQWSLDKLLASLETIEQHVLLMTGAGDLAVSPCVSQAAAKRLPRGEYQTYPNAGHLLHEERSGPIANDILEFLKIGSRTDASRAKVGQ